MEHNSMPVMVKKELDIHFVSISNQTIPEKSTY